MKIKKEKYGSYKQEDIYEYTLTNSSKLSLSVISYGAIITKILMPNRKGKVEEITINVESLEEIIQSRPFHGAIIGRVAGRISNGVYIDRGSEIMLTKNESSNTLNGGNQGLDTKNWEVVIEEKRDKISLILKTELLDGEDGFLGNIDVTVIYTLDEANRITISYEATTDQRTLFNPTNHVYFNLSGNNKENISKHQIQINSDRYAVLDSKNIPTGELRKVQNSAFDLQIEQNLGEVIHSENEQIVKRKGLDHPFLLIKDSMKPAAIIKHTDTGRVVEMSTDCDAVVIYTHNHQHEPHAKNEQKIPMHSGVTLETSALPDAINHEDFGSIWLKPEEQFNSTTQFKFFIEQ